MLILIELYQNLIASFAFVLQRHRAKPIPLKMHVSLGSPLGRAPAVAGERVVVATICPLRRLRRHLPQRERLLVSPIITQIGRENKFSADFYMRIRRGDLRSPAGEHSSPLPCSENILMRNLIKLVLFYYIKGANRRMTDWMMRTIQLRLQSAAVISRHTGKVFSMSCLT